jgi:vancomycin resistance protein YoaR
MHFSFKTGTKEPKKTSRHWLLYLAAVFFILADILAASYFIFEEYYKNKIYPGVSLGQISLGGKTAEEAKKIVEGKINDINQNGFKFYYGQNSAVLMPIISSFNGDIALQLVSFDSEKTVNSAFTIGRGQGIISNLETQIYTLLNGQQILSSFSADGDQIKRLLANNFDQFTATAENARLFATTTGLSGKKEISLGVANEKSGFRLNYSTAFMTMKDALEKLENQPIKISSVQNYPVIGKREVEPLAAAGQKFLDSTSLTLTYANKKWPVPKEKFADWLTVDLAGGNQAILNLDKNKISDWLSKKAAPQIEIPASDARFQMKDGRVIQFSKNQNGLAIDIDQTWQNLTSAWLKGGKNSINIAVATVTSNMAADQITNLGVTEIIGTGHSNFSGSPKNRIRNINVGAASLNGLLIPPGAEFSTDTSLGTVDASTGYLPEMTIMGDKTVPQFGGGLCQIGTTMFRAALASGFPITARAAHSYRVVYYEPAGTDATIFQPWPDLRFVNDSPNYILIQARISGNDLYFDFWGTKDGRVVEQTDPTIFNIVKPETTKFVETLDLKPGEKKCTERAHNGADAFFDYKVTYPDGTIKQKRFTSHYVPWREVCLIGVAQLSPTSTPATVLPN